MITTSRNSLVQRPRSLRERTDRAIVLAASVVLLVSVLSIAVFILSVATYSEHAAGHVVVDSHGVRWPVPRLPDTPGAGAHDAQ